MTGEHTYRVRCTGCRRRCEATVLAGSPAWARAAAIEEGGLCGFQQHTMAVDLWEAGVWVVVDDPAQGVANG
ncbi:MAG: hypothetical protein QME79_14180 [Bacillota bacterium]|nr:hypothetical protein [Bacillota bacterium]